MHTYIHIYDFIHVCINKLRECFCTAKIPSIV